MGGYWSYYLAMMLASYVLQYPPLLVGIAVFFVLRRWIPDPWIIFRTWGRISALKRQIDANPQNVTARRDLALIYLQRLRPGAALTLVNEALVRFPDDAELLYLKGLAHSRRGEWQDALDPLVRSVQIDARVRFGEPYLLAGDCLLQLGRTDEAIDAYERYRDSNSSSVEAHYKLAVAHSRAKEEQPAKQSLREALATWNQIPGYKRRQQVSWWLRAQLGRLWI